MWRVPAQVLTHVVAPHLAHKDLCALRATCRLFRAVGHFRPIRAMVLRMGLSAPRVLHAVRVSVVLDDTPLARVPACVLADEVALCAREDMFCASVLIVADVLETLEQLEGRCTMCSWLSWTRGVQHVCPHRAFEASRRVDYHEMQIARCVNNDDTKGAGHHRDIIACLHARSPLCVLLDDERRRRERAMRRAVEAENCTCDIKYYLQGIPCACGHQERRKALSALRWPAFRRHF